MKTTKVVVAGGGFGGLGAAKILRRHPGVALTVIDRRNHHLFQPLLYQVATAGLSPAEIAMPIRSILSGARNTEVFLGEVENVDFKKKIVRTTAGDLPYDYLVLACGSRSRAISGMMNGGRGAGPQKPRRRDQKFAGACCSRSKRAEIEKTIRIKFALALDIRHRWGRPRPVSNSRVPSARLPTSR